MPNIQRKAGNSRCETGEFPCCRPALQCGFPVTPSLQLVLPDGVEVIIIVWRDNLNRTVALDTTAVQLPPLAPLMEASVANTEQCNSGCDWSYHVSCGSSRGMI